MSPLSSTTVPPCSPSAGIAHLSTKRGQSVISCLCTLTLLFGVPASSADMLHPMFFTLNRMHEFNPSVSKMDISCASTSLLVCSCACMQLAEIPEPVSVSAGVTGWLCGRKSHCQLQMLVLTGWESPSSVYTRSQSNMSVCIFDDLMKVACVAPSVSCAV